MTDRLQADVVVVGGGPTGVAAAASARAASGGTARVVLVDDDPRGPRPVAGRPLAVLLRDAGAAGLDWAAARAAAARATADVPVEAADADGSPLAGVEVVCGRAALVTGGVEVERAGADAAAGPLRVTARRTVLATGTVPALPEVTGLTDTRYATVDTLLDVEDLPPSVAVVGAGRRGAALAQALARFGVTVTLVEAEERVLPGLDAAAASVVRAALRRDGVRLLLGARVITVAPTLDGGAWVGTQGGTDVAAELLVLTTGRAPDLVGLDLPTARVAVGRDGTVSVDDRLRTSNHDVLAVGPVSGRRTDLAAARLAGANAVARLRPAKWSPEPAVTSVPTQPAVGVVGLTEAAAVRTRPDAVVHELTGSNGLVRLIVTPDRSRLLGATVVTPGAPDAATAALLAMSAGLAPQRLADLAEPGTALATVAAALGRPGRPVGSAPSEEPDDDAAGSGPASPA